MRKDVGVVLTGDLWDRGACPHALFRDEETRTRRRLTKDYILDARGGRDGGGIQH